MSRYLETHIIQTFPPNNLNRDESGAPKTCEYGGVRRARVSSQAWKRSMREWFRTTIDPDMLAIRSREFSGMIAERLTKPVNEEILINACNSMLDALKLPKDKDHPGNTSALQFFGEQQWRQLAKLIEQAIDSGDIAGSIHDHTKEARELLQADRSIDVALFGRMSASDDKKADYDSDAAVQVAHAISVNKATVEYDYYTAVDEHDGAVGAGMIGNTGYVSSTFYRYTCVNLTQLEANLAGSKEAMRIAVANYLEAVINSIPSGKQNAFAAQTLPDLVVADIRDTRPINLVNAFETPVTGDATVPAVRQLFTVFQEAETQFNEPHPFTRITATSKARQGVPEDITDGIVTLNGLYEDVTREALDTLRLIG